MEFEWGVALADSPDAVVLCDSVVQAADTAKAWNDGTMIVARWPKGKGVVSVPGVRPRVAGRLRPEAVVVRRAVGSGDGWSAW